MYGQLPLAAVWVVSVDTSTNEMTPSFAEVEEAMAKWKDGKANDIYNISMDNAEN